jgi:hypothetical protein
MLPDSMPIRGAAMIESVLGALWFITFLIVIYGMATGGLCLWRRDVAAAPPEGDESR